LTKGFARLVGVDDDYAYMCRSPRWGSHHGTSPSCGLQVKTWSRSPKQMMAGPGLYSFPRDVVFTTIWSLLAKFLLRALELLFVVVWGQHRLVVWQSCTSSWSCVCRWCPCPEALSTCSMARVVSHGRPVVTPVSSRSWKGIFGLSRRDDMWRAYSSTGV
jgi:hypothetical protein